MSKTGYFIIFIKNFLLGVSPRYCKKACDKCNECLNREEYSAKGLIAMSNVETVCTTDDPADDLIYHIEIAKRGFKTKVYPTMRPDKLVEIGKETFLPHIKSINVKTYEELKERILFFNEMGCRLFDRTLEYVPFALGNVKEVFNKVTNNQSITKEEIYKTDILSFCAKLYVELDWTMQLHIGALRNNNTQKYNSLSADIGFDSINDLCIAEKLSLFLNNLETNNFFT